MSRSYEELEAIIEDLSKLSVYARSRAEKITNKSSSLYHKITEVASLADKMLEVKHYPTIACVELLRTAVEQCSLIDLEVHVSDYKKILKDG